MPQADTKQIVKEIQSVIDSLTKYSEEAKSELFLNGYDTSSSFLHFSSEGKMSTYEELKKACAN